MDRRTFARMLPAAALSVIGCRDSEPIAPPVTVVPRPTPPVYATAAERAFGIVDGLVSAARPHDGGVRWRVIGNGGETYPADLYAGQAGVLTFLAEAYRVKPDEKLRETLQEGGRSLRSAGVGGGRGLFDGAGGRAWAFLSIHQAIGDGSSSEWLDAARGLADAVAAAPGGLPGDLINGIPGQGLLLLRMHAVTGETSWLDDARRLADAMLESAIPSGGGIKVPSFNDAAGVPVCYTGLAHGSAGAGYFLCRLAQDLHGGQKDVYTERAEEIAAWLDGITQEDNRQVRWYRREPDQMQQLQTTWCHGPPGIGLFYAELHRLTGRQEHLDTAARCAETTADLTPPSSFACQCHGISGNAQLFLKLYRQTGAERWLTQARDFGEVAWAGRLASSGFPSWRAGDGSGADNPGLMTGRAGVGWLYLQLASDGILEGPITA